MSVPSQEPLRKNTGRLRQFGIARKPDDLYDSRKASQRVPRQDLIAKVRAIILVVFTGGVVWFLLLRIAHQLLGKR
jgi:hypothetical protein